MIDLLAPLYTLPSLAIYGLFMLATALAAALCCVLLAPLAKPPQTKEHLDVAMRTTGSVMAALTLILAFCAVQARSQATDARGMVSTEVTAIASIARIADRMGVAGRELKEQVTHYVRSIETQEFPAMAEAGAHPHTQRLAELVEFTAYQAAAGAPEVTAADLLQEVGDIEQARHRRLHAARLGLPSEFWILISLLFMLLAVTGALYPAKKHTVAMLAVQAAGCGALIAFVFIVDQPFRGAVSLSAEPYTTLLQRMEHHAAMLRQGPLYARP
jgi:hypothetical protein